MPILKPMRVCLLAALIFARRAEGQVSFAWPDGTDDVSRYTWVEECLSATTRVRDSVAAWNTGAITGTAALAARSPVRALPAAAIAQASRCAVRWPAATAPLTDFGILFKLYLAASRDADAEIVLARQLASVPGDTGARKRSESISNAINEYLDAQPARLVAAELLLVEQLARLPDSLFSPESRIASYKRLMMLARNAADTALARRNAERVVALGAALTPTQQRASWFHAWGRHDIHNALDYLSKRALLDSLRQSTEAYVALKRANWTKASGARTAAMPLPIGKPAPALEGAFWFGRSDSTASRPTKGKIALVAFLYHDCVAGMDEIRVKDCEGVYAALRRLTTRFPSVEVTLVAKTLGFAGLREPPPPAEEAELVHARAVKLNRLPIGLVVESPPIVRVEAPDRRRIHQSTPNENQYSFGDKWREINTIRAFVIDETGTVVDVVYGVGQESIDEAREIEANLNALLDVLVSRRPPSP